jgi:hypothetical protein
MVAAHKVVDQYADLNNKGITGFSGGVAASIPAVRDSTAFNMAASPQRQKLVQAQRDFVNAILRRESGAAISESEFNNAQRQYFPQPGDGPDVIEQKKQNRMLAIEGLMAGAGKGYQPPQDYVGTKGPVSAFRPAAQQPDKMTPGNGMRPPIELAPANPSERVPGRAYQSPDGRKALWTGQGWQLVP